MTTYTDVGAIVAFTNKSNIPSNYLLCDGREVSRGTYGLLFSVIGESFGSGDGVSTFNLPDLRGMFLRGLDMGSGRDADSEARKALSPGGNTGDNIGAYQDDGIAAHNHSVMMNNDYGDSPSGISSQVRSNDPAYPWLYTGANEDSVSDTRPKNVGIVYIIKYLPDSANTPTNIKCFASTYDSTTEYSTDVNSVVLKLKEVGGTSVALDPYNMISEYMIGFPVGGIYSISASLGAQSYSSDTPKEIGLSVYNHRTGVPLIQLAPSYYPSANNLIVNLSSDTLLELRASFPLGYGSIKYFSVAVQMLESGES